MSRAAYLREWKLQNQDKVREYNHRHYNPGYPHGLTKEEYVAKRDQQQGHCAACGVVAEELHLDHDHQTGVLRGFLCRSCNLALGLVGDSRAVLQALIEYLTREEAQ